MHDQRLKRARKHGTGSAVVPIVTRGGLTLLELLIILAAIVVIIFIALPTLQPTELEQEIAFVKDRLLYLHEQESLYYQRKGKYVPFSVLATDEHIGPSFDQRFAEDSPIVNNVQFRGPVGDGVIFDITAELTDGSRYKIDQNGKIVVLQ